ncbi:hypothetical protein PR048_015837 [Dryococelus australis]|uniref:Uncharacterized protein n=1 Tax=Dryococelus australis TaxID=614101 RepID=A0ABQ9HI15_9NEOP|nr:hypothetical protein PR048_015837 [Dryococelus australis]
MQNNKQAACGTRRDPSNKKGRAGSFSTSGFHLTTRNPIAGLLVRAVANQTLRPGWIWECKSAFLCRLLTAVVIAVGASFAYLVCIHGELYKSQLIDCLFMKHFKGAYVEVYALRMRANLAVRINNYDIACLIGSKIDTENCCTIRVQNWTGDRDEVYFELLKLAVLNIDPRSAAIIDESETQNHKISFVQHHYIGIKIKLDPSLELGSFDFGTGMMLVEPGISNRHSVNIPPHSECCRWLVLVFDVGNNRFMCSGCLDCHRNDNIVVRAAKMSSCGLGMVRSLKPEVVGNTEMYPCHEVPPYCKTLRYQRAGLVGNPMVTEQCNSKYWALHMGVYKGAMLSGRRMGLDERIGYISVVFCARRSGGVLCDDRRASRATVSGLHLSLSDCICPGLQLVQPASRTLHCLKLAVADFPSADRFSRRSFLFSFFVLRSMLQPLILSLTTTTLLPGSEACYTFISVALNIWKVQRPPTHSCGVGQGQRRRPGTQLYKVLNHADVVYTGRLDLRRNYRALSQTPLRNVAYSYVSYRLCDNRTASEAGRRLVPFGSAWFGMDLLEKQKTCYHVATRAIQWLGLAAEPLYCAGCHIANVPEIPGACLWSFVLDNTLTNALEFEYTDPTQSPKTENTQEQQREAEDIPSAVPVSLERRQPVCIAGSFHQEYEVAHLAIQETTRVVLSLQASTPLSQPGPSSIPSETVYTQNEQPILNRHHCLIPKKRTANRKTVIGFQPGVAAEANLENRVDKYQVAEMNVQAVETKDWSVISHVKMLSVGKWFCTTQIGSPTPGLRTGNRLTPTGSAINQTGIAVVLPRVSHDGDNCADIYLGRDGVSQQEIETNNLAAKSITGENLCITEFGGKVDLINKLLHLNILSERPSVKHCNELIIPCEELPLEDNCIEKGDRNESSGTDPCNELSQGNTCAGKGNSSQMRAGDVLCHARDGVVNVLETAKRGTLSVLARAETIIRRGGLGRQVEEAVYRVDLKSTVS